MGKTALLRVKEHASQTYTACRLAGLMGDLETGGKAIGDEQAAALQSAKLGGLKKKINAAGWSDNMELLLKNWGEKSAGLRFMHQHSGGVWKAWADKLSLSAILITTLSSSAALAS